MLKLIRNFIKEEDGMGTVEVVIIVAVLVAIALIFRRAIFNFVKNIMSKIFGEELEGEVLEGVPD
ncbi:Flp1 family type IVb pilin [Acetivibrio mesophilus]|uniref:Putative Flagellin Flp1-like domain-containing protein n=1 Tax=Acetivibrio mesophilus TaxID=2487273 RepID=A0A4Q0I384_9FIRM|nr:Flp1 family type IVb pilin [Acetivibrio mesophilus]ODM24867.1 hypothetical protein A7W90_00810 [Clostridium sp. Bc-iso-3]RXE58703.1 hypothetical protein EFD62_11060 [Acetivibrio mesophilus]HHV29394.1 hypothetical protein [Clostridium sp.]